MIANAPAKTEELSPRTRRILETVRRALIMILNAIEAELGIANQRR